jgi:hypothetical protein
VSGQTDGGEPGGPEQESRAQAGPEQVGSVAEEAAKLLGAFSGWAKEQGDGLSAFTDGLHDHVSSEAPECTWCPVCRTVAAVRQTSPEVIAHLSSAASSLMLAVSGMMAPPESGQDGVERIPLDEDEWPEDEA